MRETGNEDYLPLTLEAARVSLAAVIPERNVGALIALAHAEFTNHDFAAAREHALALIPFTRRRVNPTPFYEARPELGDYSGAAEAFAELQRWSSGDAGTETRLARSPFSKGGRTKRTHVLVLPVL